MKIRKLSEPPTIIEVDIRFEDIPRNQGVPLDVGDGVERFVYNIEGRPVILRNP